MPRVVKTSRWYKNHLRQGKEEKRQSEHSLVIPPLGEPITYHNRLSGDDKPESLHASFMADEGAASVYRLKPEGDPEGEMYVIVMADTIGVGLYE